MKLQELIKKYGSSTKDWGAEVLKSDVFEDLNKLKDSQVEGVPQFIADYIEYGKRQKFTLFGYLDPDSEFESSVDEIFKGDMRKCVRWCRRNSDLFARSLVNGYKITESTKYKVIMKSVSPNSCMLKYYYDTERWIMGAVMHFNDARLYHTKEELETGGFGEVFDNPLFEVEEVEE